MSDISHATRSIGTVSGWSRYRSNGTGSAGTIIFYKDIVPMGRPFITYGHL